MTFYVFYVVLLTGVLSAPFSVDNELHPVLRANLTDEEALAKARQLLSQYPLTDGHNDLPHQYRMRIENKIGDIDLNLNISAIWEGSHTDIPRLRAGQVGAQFWVAYVRCSKLGKDAVRATLEQIDVIHRMVDTYPDDMAWVTTPDELEAAFSAGKIGGMIGIEGGHSIDSSTATLRIAYAMGTRYMGLTHNCRTPWAEHNNADAEPVPPSEGLSAFGISVVQEMNRLGMIIDLSHVSKSTMIDAINMSQAPVIFSHSNAWALCQHTRNVQDDVLQLMAQNGGVAMVTFVPSFLNCFPSDTSAPDITMVADHIQYIRDLVGVDYVGIGGDYDGTSSIAEGLEDVSRYPYLIAELVQRGWTDEEVEKVIGRNVVRVWRAVEQVRDSLVGVAPIDDWIPQEDIDPANTCRTTE